MKFLLTAITLLSLNVFARDGISSGGLPRYVSPADVDFSCTGEYAIYLINGDERHYGVYTQAFDWKIKKGEDIGGAPGLSQPFSQGTWIMDSTKSENVSEELFKPFLEADLSASLMFQWADYSKTDEVDLSIWLNSPDAVEHVASGTIGLSQKSFNLESMYKVRSDNYTAVSLKISCHK
jgi:hypothetical protein